MSAQSKLGRGSTSRLGRLHAAQRSRCFYCDRTMTLRAAGEPWSAADATIDHFFPRSAGGPDGWSNWVLACQGCNNNKGSRPPSEEQIAAWNHLASKWPYIRPIDPALIQKKRCTVCARWISPMRLGESIRAGCETRTCQSRCGRAKPRRAREPQAVEQRQGGQQKDGGSWVDRLLGWVRTCLARLH